MTKAVTIVTTWEAENEVELTDDEYVEFVATGDPPDEVLSSMSLNTDNATLVDWKRKLPDFRAENKKLKEGS